MAILTTGNSYSTGDQVTAATQNAQVNNATFASGAVDDSTTALSSGAIIVKDDGITSSKISAGGPQWDASGNFKCTPGTSNTPSTNGDLSIEATSNTTLTFKLKGTDGTVRTGTVTLS